MSLRFPIALVLSLVCLATPVWAGIDAGKEAFDRGDYATALREWRPMAERGDVRAQAILGGLYHDGKGVSQDYVQAREWYEKAAAQGESAAQYGLGSLYANGKGVPRDYAHARQWFLKAAVQGFADAERYLGDSISMDLGLNTIPVRPCTGSVGPSITGASWPSEGLA